MALKYLPPTSPKAQAAVKMYFDAISTEKRAATIGAYSVYLKRIPDQQLSLLTAHQLYAALPQSSSAANLCFSVFKAFLSWCVERDLLGSNPLLLRKQP